MQNICKKNIESSIYLSKNALDRNNEHFVKWLNDHATFYVLEFSSLPIQFFCHLMSLSNITKLCVT